MIHVDSFESSQINNIFNPPYFVQGGYSLVQIDFLHVK